MRWPPPLPKKKKNKRKKSRREDVPEYWDTLLKCTPPGGPVAPTTLKIWVLGQFHQMVVLVWYALGPRVVEDALVHVYFEADGPIVEYRSKVYHWRVMGPWSECVAFAGSPMFTISRIRTERVDMLFVVDDIQRKIDLWSREAFRLTLGIQLNLRRVTREERTRFLNHNWDMRIPFSAAYIRRVYCRPRPEKKNSAVKTNFDL
jgi:hypothetical protein